MCVLLSALKLQLVGERTQQRARATLVSTTLQRLYCGDYLYVACMFRAVFGDA